MCRSLANLEVDVAELSINGDSGSRHVLWPGTESRPSMLLVCTMMGTAAATAASMLLAQRYMLRGSSIRSR